MSRLSGQATVGGSPQANVPIAIIDTNGSSDPSQWSIVATTTTDANGDWEVTGLATNAVERYHAVAQYDDGAQLYNVESLPYLSTDAYLAAPTAEWSYQTPPATIADAIPDSGLARYEFEQSVTDSWNENDLTDNTSAGYTTSAQVGDYAKVLDGVDDYLTAPFNFDSSEDFSVVGWVYFASFPGDYQPVFAQRESSFSDMDWMLYYDSRSGHNSWVISIGESGASITETGDSESTGSYTHVGLTKGGDTWTLYLGGSQAYQMTDSTSWTTSEALQFGSWQSGDTVMDGRLDHVDWFTDELTASEVSNHFNSGSIDG